jgi:hypothetical protein
VAWVTSAIRSSSSRVLRQVSAVVLDHADEQQRQPAQLDMGAHTVLAVVEHPAQRQRALHVPPAALDRGELLVGRGQVVGGQGDVGCAQRPVAVQALLSLDPGVIDA